MICRNCLSRGVSALRQTSFVSRSFSTSMIARNAAVAPLSTPLASTPSATESTETPVARSLPISAAPAGTKLVGLNYIKGKEDPVALSEEEYPEWLWTCLDSDKKAASGDGAIDEFSKSKKQRKLAAKRQRKLEEQMLASGNLDALIPKVPLQEQTIDLPSNPESTVEGALEAIKVRRELTSAMRNERRAKIKESNFLKGVK